MASLLAGGQTLLICGCDSNPKLRCPSYRREVEDSTSIFFWLHAAGAALVLSGALVFANLRLHAAEASDGLVGRAQGSAVRKLEQ